MSFILKFSKIKSFNALRGLSNHDHRTCIGSMPHVDVNKTELNRYLPGTEGVDYVALWHDREYSCNANGGQVKLRKNSVYAINAYMSFSHDSEKDLDFDINEWYEANVAWLQKEFGKENLIAATLHLDETTPHIHAVITPIDERGKLNIRAFLAGKSSLRAHRQDYAKAMEPFGLKEGLQYRKSDHKAIQKFYNNINICETTKVPTRQEGEAIWEWEDRVNGFVQGLMYKWLQDREQAKKKLGEKDALRKQEYIRYHDAIELYNIILQKFDGDTDMVKRELEYYKTAEQEIPMEAWEKLMQEVAEKLVHHNNLVTMDTGQMTPAGQEQMDGSEMPSGDAEIGSGERTE